MKVTESFVTTMQAEGGACRIGLQECHDTLMHAPIGIFTSVPEGRYVSLNPAMARMYGYESPEEMLTLIRDIATQVYVDPADRELLLRLLEQNGEVLNYESRRLRRDGSMFWVSLNARIIVDPNSGAVRYQGFSTDISQRKLAEQARLESEERFRLLFQNAPMPYQSLDEKGNFLDVNQSFLHVLGYSREELIGKNFGDVLHPDWVDHFKTNFPKFKAIGEILGVEFEMVKKDGSTILVFFNGKIQKDAQGRFQRTHCIFQDVSEQRRVEQALEKSREELKALLADKDKFFSIIAHDLRSPLSGLLGLAEMMGRDDGGLSPKELRNIAKIMGKTVGDLFALLENLLDWSRMQRGLTAFEPVPCVLREVIAANIGLLRPWAIQKEVVLSNTVASKLVVSADQAMLNTVIRNLLSNALKFTERGGTVNIRAVEANADVTVAVQDSGVGMDRETMEGIFSMTRKTRNRGTEGESGSGLGLLLCKEFVERHGGRIWAESAPGLGSTFFFTLSQDKIREA
ncbi:sensor histidine kinase [Desulfonatronum lacustre]|uniref:sensor histidine kinase n=1 Tax=Desulfonatronum lacustre TaxID=66849 RepID=UPI0004B8FC99|nr:PAS domain-containing sensor histidine kinase [Desulfonatronum lacustre]